MMRRAVVLAVLLTGCAHHPLSCAIGLAYDDCLEGTAGAAKYRAGYRIDPVAEMQLMNYVAGQNTAAAAQQQHIYDSYMHTLTPPSVIVVRPY